MQRLRYGSAVGVLALVSAAAGQEPAPEPREGERQEDKKEEMNEDAADRERPKVYTNEDLSSTSGRISVVGKPAAPRATPSPEAAAGDGAQGPHEEDWRRRGRQHRRALADAEVRLARLEAEVEELDSQLDMTAGAVVGPLMGQLQRAREARDQAAAELDEARAALDELQREARRIRIPPGWLRE